MKRILYAQNGKVANDIDITIFSDDVVEVESDLFDGCSCAVKLYRLPEPNQDVMHVLVHLESGFEINSEE